MIPDVLVCPLTRAALEQGAANSSIIEAASGTRYRMIDGILDLCDPVSSAADAYASLSGSYDLYLTSATWRTKLYNRFVWGLDDEDYVDCLFALCPENVTGTLVEVPVGTGVFSYEFYKRLDQRVSVIVVDYSWEMLRAAKARFDDAGLKNVTYVRADVGRLPLRDGSADLLLTMNGFHAFPDKQAALAEFARVTRPASALLGCFYVRGQRRLTDLFVRHVYCRMGAFAQPFFGKEEVRSRWGANFEFECFENMKSILYFRGVCRSGGAYAVRRDPVETDHEYDPQSCRRLVHSQRNHQRGFSPEDSHGGPATEGLRSRRRNNCRGGCSARW